MTGLHCSLRWNHLRVKGTASEQVPDLVLFDFGLHRFDLLTSLTGRLADRVQAQALATPSAGIRPPMPGAALRDIGMAQASLILAAATPFGPRDTTDIAGTRGNLTSQGPDPGRQSVARCTEAGMARPVPEGQRFNDGFAGAMGEPLCAVQDGREPENGARGNLILLANCFAALRAAAAGQPQGPGQVRRREV